jgi:hypothetical protein
MNNPKSFVSYVVNVELKILLTGKHSAKVSNRGFKERDRIGCFRDPIIYGGNKFRNVFDDFWELHYDCCT